VKVPLGSDALSLSVTPTPRRFAAPTTTTISASNFRFSWCSGDAGGAAGAPLSVSGSPA